jgi:hypothetical protein
LTECGSELRSLQVLSIYLVLFTPPSIAKIYAQGEQNG